MAGSSERRRDDPMPLPAWAGCGGCPMASYRAWRGDGGGFVMDDRLA